METMNSSSQRLNRISKALEVVCVCVCVRVCACACVCVCLCVECVAMLPHSNVYTIHLDILTIFCTEAQT